MKRKRILSFMMAFILCLSLLPLGAFAAEAEPAAEEIVFEDETESVTAEEENAAAEETAEPAPEIIEEESEECCTEAAEEVAADSATSGYCDDYNQVKWTLDSSGTLTVSGSGAMQYYMEGLDKTAVKKVVIESGITKIGLFADCVNLTGVSIGSDVVTIREGAFAGCTGLKSITIPGNVEIIENSAFKNCSSLSSVTLSEGLTGIDFSAFENCTSLTRITIPKSVEYVSTAFDGCSKLSSVTFTAGGHTSIYYYVFKDLTSLKTADLSGVYSIGKQAFDGCTALTTVTLKEGLEDIEPWAFSDCSSLKSISIPASVENIASLAFDGCDSMTAIYVASGNSNYCSVNGVLYNKSKTELMLCPMAKSGAIVIPGTVTCLSDVAFYGCTGITSITLPAGLTEIGEYAFSYTSISSISIPSGVSVISESAFRGCSKLSSVTLPDTVTAIGVSAFSQCSSLVSITLPASLSAIQSNTFYGCSGLKSVYIPGNVSVIGANAFAYCSGLENIYYGGTLNRWQYDVTVYENGNEAVANASVICGCGKPVNVTLSYNYGSGSELRAVPVGQSITLPTLTRTGYTFQGWATSSTATAASYKGGASYKVSKATTLYAVWKVKTSKITYNANGGTGAPASGTKTYGKSYTISSTVPTRTGYAFLGWSGSKTATKASYLPGKSYSSVYLTLYAVWAKGSKVTFNANGGTGGPGTGYKASGVAYTVPTTKPTRTGYTFLGWSNSKTATTAKYLPGKSYTSMYLTLYAVWAKNSTITYNANGGSGGPKTGIKVSGVAYTVPTTKPTRTGYTFLGWSNSKTATTAKYLPGKSYTSMYLTLYAVWKKN